MSIKLNRSIEEITKIIAKDIGGSGVIAHTMAKRLANLHQDLEPTVSAYLSGKPASFTLGDITLQTIMEKEHCSLPEALFSMSTLLENPELAERYKTLNFRYDHL